MKMLRRLWRRGQRAFNRLPEWARLSTMGFAAIILFGTGGMLAWAAFMPIPSIDNFENRAVALSTKIYDRTGDIVLYDVHGSMRRTAIPLESMSPYVQQATIAIEDASFYEHHGFRPLAFIRAVLVNISTGSFSEGGSTITQQVVKNALLTQKKTITRKLKEIILAIRLDRLYPKDKILETYLNENPYGGTIYGIQEASQYFFGVDAADLDLAQAAYLAALPQAPTYYSPHGNHREDLDTRAEYVLFRMQELGYITEEEYEEAKNEEVQFRDEAEAGIKAPHFVFYIREYLESKYGADEVQSGGLRVVTTLDYDLQLMAEKTIADNAARMERDFNASNEGIVAIEPSTGQILTMVGSRGYFDDSIDGMVNVTIQPRQPGSSFKPFVYATAFQKGYTPDTVVFDLPTQFSARCAASDNFNSNPPCYSPGNYDDTYRGPVKLRDALAQSLNIPAVKALYLAGVPDSIETARKLGITTLTDPARYGLTLVLGGGEVKLLELVGAYGVFGNDGARHPITGILRVEDKHGRVLESYENKSEQVMDPQIARLMNDVLSDNTARIPAFGANSPLYFPGYDVAAKTGTTNDYRDVWIVGYTPGIAVGAWAGNNDNSAMVRRVASFIIAPMWHEFMAQAIEKYPSGGFVPPTPDPELESLPPVLRGEWNTNASEGVHDILHWVKKDNPRSGRPSNPWSDPQYSQWEYPVQAWVAGIVASSTPQGGGGAFQVLSPASGTITPVNAPITISSYHPNPQAVTQVSYFVNDVAVGSATQAPYTITYVPTMPGPATLRAVAFTSTGNETQMVPFMVQ